MKPLPQLVDVATALRPLDRTVVFVGGTIRDLLITDPGASGSRPTDDVDLIVAGMDSAGEYHELGKQLRQLGFHECEDKGAPICRWNWNEVVVDVMPVDPAVLGFSNVWYQSGVENVAVRPSVAFKSFR